MMTTWLALIAAAITYSAQEGTMHEKCENEVLELHQFFEDWFNGKLANNAAAFARFDGVMAADFEIISPDGESSSRAGIIERLKGAHGFQAEAETPMRIWIENLRSRSLTDGLYLVTYEEWQESAGDVRARLSSAIFSTRDETPNGVQWHHVHETWRPEN